MIRSTWRKPRPCLAIIACVAAVWALPLASAQAELSAQQAQSLGLTSSDLATAKAKVTQALKHGKKGVEELLAETTSPDPALAADLLEHATVKIKTTHRKTTAEDLTEAGEESASAAAQAPESTENTESTETSESAESAEGQEGEERGGNPEDIEAAKRLDGLNTAALAPGCKYNTVGDRHTIGIKGVNAGWQETFEHGFCWGNEKITWWGGGGSPQRWSAFLFCWTNTSSTDAWNSYPKWRESWARGSLGGNSGFGCVPLQSDRPVIYYANGGGIFRY